MNRFKTYKIKTMAWLTGLAVLALIGTVGISQIKKTAPLNNQQPITVDTTIHDEDSVEIVGTPTDDDPWKELDKIVTAYYSKGGNTYKGVVSVIDDNGDKEKVVEKQDFEYSVLGNNYHYRLGDMEMINKKDYLVAIDHLNKTIAVSLQHGSGKENRLFDINAFKKIMLEQKADARITQSGNEKILTLDNVKHPGIQGYRIYYSPDNYHVSTMLIGMARLQPLDESDIKDNDGAETYYYYLEVQYTAVQALTLNNNNFNPENKFIKIIAKKAELMPEFKDYQLVGNE